MGNNSCPPLLHLPSELPSFLVSIERDLREDCGICGSVWLWSGIGLEGMGYGTFGGGYGERGFGNGWIAGERGDGRGKDLQAVGNHQS